MVVTSTHDSPCWIFGHHKNMAAMALVNREKLLAIVAIILQLDMTSNMQMIL
jgi:hypothetical protein